METNKGRIFLNTLFWGFVLWLFGYILGILFFALVPKDVLGWYIMPFGLAATLWVLFRKIERESFTCYVGLGVVWAVMALVLDYVFLVTLFNSSDYYKLDVYVYYVLTLVLPPIVGWIKMRKTKKE